MYHYQSEFTQFLNDYLEQNPQEAQRRITNRSKLWEVDLKEEDLDSFGKADLPRNSYAYQPD